MYSVYIQNQTLLRLLFCCGCTQGRVHRGWTALSRVDAFTWQMESFLLKPPFDLRVTGSLRETLTLRWLIVHSLKSLRPPCLLYLTTLICYAVSIFTRCHLKPVDLHACSALAETCLAHSKDHKEIEVLLSGCLKGIKFVHACFSYAIQKRLL